MPFGLVDPDELLRRMIDALQVLTAQRDMDGMRHLLLDAQDRARLLEWRRALPADHSDYLDAPNDSRDDCSAHVP